VRGTGAKLRFFLGNLAELLYFYPLSIFTFFIKNCKYLGGARFTRTKRRNVVHFSGFARKMNHLSAFCERREHHLSSKEILTYVMKHPKVFQKIGALVKLLNFARK
jgi:hypothetical protein